MAVDPARAKSLFLAASDLAGPDERAAYLDRECGSDADLRARVEALLQAHEAAVPPGMAAADATGTFATVAPAGDPVPTAAYHPTDAPGQVLASRYTLVEPIGEGGMGSVWRAKQTDPVKRFVAVKLIKAGMDSKQVLARFEAERQALALMDHPNIAKVLDGGLHDGRPFFVMELVKGTPITDFCDARKLSPNERLELFVQACQAVQHAHQKGVIHRDLKPSNVLVALYDDTPVVKVIDFGVAKATGVALTERTIDTGFGGIVGTPEYMSPEQATFNNLDVDTRSDVYALGVLLYELLAGSPPFSRKELEHKGLLEMLRVVREEEPPRPSAKYSTSQARAGIAASRASEPEKLAGLMRGELDWIVMRALEKDRARRYDTANAFAADVQRYLAGEQVQAVPPSLGYRLKKLVRRNRPQVIAACAVLLALVAGVIGTAWQAVRATSAERVAAAAAATERAARDEAEDQRERAAAAEQQARNDSASARAVRDFLQNDLLGQANIINQAETARLNRANFAAKKNPTIEELTDRAAAALAEDRIEAKFPGQPVAQAEALRAVGEAYRGVGQLKKAVALLNRAVTLSTTVRGADDPGTLTARHELAMATTSDRDAAELFDAVARDRARVLGPHHPETFDSRIQAAVCRALDGDLLDPVGTFERLRAETRQHLGPLHFHTIHVTSQYVYALQMSERQADALRAIEALRAEALGQGVRPDHPFYQIGLAMAAEAYLATGQTERGWELVEELAAGPTGPVLHAGLIILGHRMMATGKPADGIKAFEWAVTLAGTDPDARVRALSSLGHGLRRVGRNADEVKVREEQRDIVVGRKPANHPDVLEAMKELAAAYNGADRRAEGTAMLEDVVRRLRSSLGPTHPQTLGAMMSLSWGLYGKPRAAELAGEVAAARRKMVGPNNMQLASELSTWGINLALTGRPAEGEAPLREALAIRKKVEPNGWLAALNEAELGYCLLAQKRYADAEPVLLAAYHHMVARKQLMPAYHADHPAKTRRQLAQLYTATGRPEEAAKWTDRPNEVAPPPREKK